MLKLIFSIIKLKTKIEFKPPIQKDIILYDNISTFLSAYLKKNTYSILYTRFERINLYIIFKSFFLFPKKNFFTKYVYTYIKFINPKVIITFNHNQLLIYLIKNNFKNIKIISIQNGLTSYSSSRSFSPNIRKNLNYLKKLNLRCDYFFVLNKRSKLMFSKFIKSKFIESGSFKSNMCLKNLTAASGNYICFISQYSNSKKNFKMNFNKLEEIVINQLVNFCKKINIKCFIYLRWNSLEEINYFKSIIKDKINFFEFKYITKEHNKKKFEFFDKASLTVFIDSALGYEIIARKKKVCIISARDQFLKSSRGTHYGNDEDIYDNEGIFWLNRFKNESEIFRKIESVYNLPLKKLINNYNANKDSLFYEDFANSKFKKVLREIYP